MRLCNVIIDIFFPYSYQYLMILQWRLRTGAQHETYCSTLYKKNIKNKNKKPLLLIHEMTEIYLWNSINVLMFYYGMLNYGAFLRWSASYDYLCKLQRDYSLNYHLQFNLSQWTFSFPFPSHPFFLECYSENHILPK